MTETPRTVLGQVAVSLYNDVQLMREMHWSYDELMDAPEDIVWAAMTILSLEAKEQKAKMKKAERGGQQNAAYRQPIEIPPLPPPR